MAKKPTEGPRRQSRRSCKVVTVNFQAELTEQGQKVQTREEFLYEGQFWRREKKKRRSTVVAPRGSLLRAIGGQSAGVTSSSFDLGGIWERGTLPLVRLLWG